MLLLFGAKRLRNVGGDLGAAVKGFKKAVKDEEDKSEGETDKLEKSEGSVIDAEVTKVKEEDKS